MCKARSLPHHIVQAPTYRPSQSGNRKSPPGLRLDQISHQQSARFLHRYRPFPIPVLARQRLQVVWEAEVNQRLMIPASR